ncbi:tetrahydromethanopterin S-methyltransferase subunit MtrC [Methanopyrus sp.]
MLARTLLLSAVAPGGEEEEEEVEVAVAIPPWKLILAGVVSGIVGISLAWVHPVIPAIAAIPVIMWGADAVRRVAGYGLGTGVPSIGYMGLGGGSVAALLAVAMTNVTYAPIAAAVGTILGAAIGALLGVLDRRVIKMKIPVMERCSTEIVAAGTLALMCLMAAVAGDFTWSAVYSRVIRTGIIAVLWVACALSLLHPYNACLGPSETQERTLSLAAECGSISAIVAGLASANPIVLIAGGIAWLISFWKFWGYTKRDAADVVWTGVVPKGE